MSSPFSRLSLAAVTASSVLFFPPNSQAIDSTPWLWAAICGHASGDLIAPAAYRVPAEPIQPTAPCAAAPTGYHHLPEASGDGDVSVDLLVGAGASTLCYVYHGVPEAPVIRIQRGHRLTVHLTNTLHNTGPYNTSNCLLQDYLGDGTCSQPEQGLRAAPGADASYYPIEATVPHLADGTANLHVHGLIVSSRPCHDEVVRSAIYPANWNGPITRLLPCQAAPNELTYTYDVPADHPEGLYWYHTHRHGQAEAASMLGLVGAIVIEGPDDLRRAAMGVTDDVLVIHDVPMAASDQPASPKSPHHRSVLNRTVRHHDAAPRVDPRIDEANEVSCEADDPDTGGPAVTRLTLNGALVPESADGSMPPDGQVLTKTMRPGQTEIWRILNASADTAIRPRLVMVQNGIKTSLPLKVIARDGVPVADDAGYPFMDSIDTVARPVLLDPANRLEVVVNAPPPGATLYLDSAQIVTGCAGDGAPARRLLRVVSDGPPVDPVPDSAVAPADTDVYYTHILDQVPTVQRTLAFTEYPRAFTNAHSDWIGAAPQPGDFDPGATDFFLTQIDSSADPTLSPAIRPYDMSGHRPDVVVHLHGADRVTEEWTIQNYTLEYHAFHIHQVHFRAITGGRDPATAPLLDTVNVPFAANVGGAPASPGQTRILLTFTRAEIGEFVFHCHVLEHEDGGMMQTIRVVAD